MQGYCGALANGRECLKVSFSDCALWQVCGAMSAGIPRGHRGGIVEFTGVSRLSANRDPPPGRIVV